MVFASLEKFRVARTVLGRVGGVEMSSDSPRRGSGEWRRERFDVVAACGCSVPRRFRVMRPPPAEGSSWEASRASDMPAGVDGSSFTLPRLAGRSSEVGIAPGAVLTEWLRVMRAESSAVDETVESGLRSRFVRPRARVARGAGAGSGSADCSDCAPSRLRVDRVDRPTGSERFNTGLRGSAAGDGRGVPGFRYDGRLRPPLGLPLGGGVASAAMTSVTMGLVGGTPR